MKLQVKYSIRAERVVGILLIMLAVLIVVHLIAMQLNFNEDLGFKEAYDLHYWQVSFFDLDEESGFGTWFNSGLLLIAGILLFIKARMLHLNKDIWRIWWMLLGVGFLILSVDEIAGIHEWFNSMLEDDTPWTHFAAILVGIIGLAYIPFLKKYWKRTSVLFLIAGAIYIGGAVGVEHFTDSDVNSLHYNMYTALEEGMEMLGVIILIYALLDNIRGKTNKDFEINIAVHSLNKNDDYLN